MKIKQNPAVIKAQKLAATIHSGGSYIVKKDQAVPAGDKGAAIQSKQEKK